MKSTLPYIRTRRILGIFLFSLLLMISCKNENSTENTPEIIDISNYTKTDSILSIRSLMEDVSYIQLKGADTFFLSDTKKILEIDNKLIIHDKNKEVLVAYDLEGNFLGHVGGKGVGPEEYRKVNDFDIHPQRNSIIIFSRGDLGFLEFDHNLNFVQKVRLDIWAMQMSILESGNLAFYVGFTKGSNNIFIFDIEGNKIEERMPFPNDQELFPINFTGFIKGDYYTYSLSSVIHKIQEGEDKDNGIYSISFPSMRKEEDKFNFQSLLTAKNDQAGIQHLYSFTLGGKNSKEVLFYYGYRISQATRGSTLGVKNESGQIFSHHNLKHGSQSKSDEFVKLFFLDFYTLPSYSSKSNFYYVVSTQEGLDYLHRKEKDTFLEGLKSIDLDLYNTLKDAKDGDNPVVMRFKLKDKI